MSNRWLFFNNSNNKLMEFSEEIARVMLSDDNFVTLARTNMLVVTSGVWMIVDEFVVFAPASATLD